MNYTHSFSIVATNDVQNAVDYIEYALKSPQAAHSLVLELKRTINYLVFSPTMRPIIHDIVLAHWKIRFIPVKNYLLFYTINEDLHEVRLQRFLYSRSDWRTILKSSPNTFYVEPEHKEHYLHDGSNAEEYGMPKEPETKV